MATTTTRTSAPAWSPDITVFAPSEVIPDAIILRAATVVTEELEGDSPVARVAWINDDEADFIAEGAEIPEADPALAEVTVSTGKVSQLVRISREQWRQANTAGLLSDSVARAVTKAGNRAFISQAAPAAGEVTPPAGILNAVGLIDGGEITTDLDPLADALAVLEDNGATPRMILASPTSFAAIRKLKTATGANTTLLGSGVEDQVKRLLGLEVITSPAVPAGKLIVVDPAAIVAAVGQVQVASSEHTYFTSDSIALRATWRIGWKVMHPDRIATIDIAA